MRWGFTPLPPPPGPRHVGRAGRWPESDRTRPAVTDSQTPHASPAPPDAPDGPRLTIVTSTWNRRALLERNFTSLMAQTRTDRIDWLVVDDGSTDDTSGFIRRVAADAPFPVRLIVQPHGGKHRALNRAVPEVTAPWMLVLDSDDWLLPDGLAHAFDEIDARHDDPATAAIVSPRVFAGRVPPHYPDDLAPMNYASWRTHYFKSDFSMLVRTGVMRAWPFPVFDGELFVAESAVYARAFARVSAPAGEPAKESPGGETDSRSGTSGGIRLSNTHVIGAEYQKTGLSAKSRDNRVACPLGAAFTYRAQLESGLRGRQRIRSWLNYHRFACHARARGLALTPDPPPDGTIWRPGGWLLYRLDLRAGCQTAPAGPAPQGADP